MLSEVWVACPVVQRSAGESQLEIRLAREGCTAAMELVRDPYEAVPGPGVRYEFLLGVDYDEPAVQVEFSEPQRALGWTAVEFDVAGGRLVVVATSGSSVLWADLASGSARLVRQLERDRGSHDTLSLSLFLRGSALLIITESDLLQLDLTTGEVLSDVPIGGALEFWRPITADATTVTFRSAQGQSWEIPLDPSLAQSRRSAAATKPEPPPGLLAPGQTSLQWTVENSADWTNEQVVAWLGVALDAGEDPWELGPGGESAYDIAARVGNATALRMFRAVREGRNHWEDDPEA